MFLLPDEQQGGFIPGLCDRHASQVFFNVMTAYRVSKGYIQPLHVRLQTRRVDERLNLFSRSASHSESSPSRHKNAAVTEIRGGEVIFNVCPCPSQGCLLASTFSHPQLQQRNLQLDQRRCVHRETFKPPDQIQIKPMSLLRDMFLPKCDEFFQFRCNSYMK